MLKIVGPNAVAGEVKCLGWCEGTFVSPDKARIRYCKRCAAEKERLEKGMPRIRSFGTTPSGFTAE